MTKRCAFNNPQKVVRYTVSMNKQQVRACWYRQTPRSIKSLFDGIYPMIIRLQVSSCNLHGKAKTLQLQIRHSFRYESMDFVEINFFIYTSCTPRQGNEEDRTYFFQPWMKWHKIATVAKLKSVALNGNNIYCYKLGFTQTGRSSNVNENRITWINASLPCPFHVFESNSRGQKVKMPRD